MHGHARHSTIPKFPRKITHRALIAPLQAARLGRGNYIASSTYTAYTLYNPCAPTAILNKASPTSESKVKYTRQIVVLPTPPVYR